MSVPFERDPTGLIFTLVRCVATLLFCLLEIVENMLFSFQRDGRSKVLCDIFIQF